MPLRLLRVANPTVRALLRSPLHWLLSGSLAVLVYEGHRSHRTFAVPLLYAERADDYIVLAATPARKRWWRTFREPAAASLLIRGAWHEVEGRVLDGPECEAARADYIARFPRAGRRLGVGSESSDQVPAALVAFTHRERSQARVAEPAARCRA